MRCADIMKTDLECVTPETTVQTAAQRMRIENVGFLPVCDSSKKVVGTITDRDLAIRVLADARPESLPVQDVMTRDIVSCRPEDDLRVAEELMARHRKSRIVCLDGRDQLVGVISLSDIADRNDGNRAVRTMQGVSSREVRA